MKRDASPNFTWQNVSARKTANGATRAMSGDVVGCLKNRFITRPNSRLSRSQTWEAQLVRVAVPLDDYGLPFNFQNARTANFVAHEQHFAADACGELSHSK